MSKSAAQLKQLTSLPITWLSEGKLKLSTLLRHEAARTGNTQEALRYLIQEKIFPSRVLATFPHIREPDRQLLQSASNDYLRCILARSVAEVYRKVTPRYRNEAARKQFFKRLAQIAESIHLSESSKWLHEIFREDASDNVTAWINSELESLVTERADLANEYHAKLNSARHEFGSALRQLEDLIGITWAESERFQEPLTISSFFPPAVYENENTWRWGSQWYPELGVLNVYPPLLFFETLRKGVLAREAAILLSPRNLDTIGKEPAELCEQAEYLAYKLFERQNDKELWSEARHGLRQKTRFRAHELIDFFHFYEMMVGDSLYRELWSRFRELRGAHLTSADYRGIFLSLASRPTTPKFDGDELQLLNLLSKRPDVAAGEAAQQLGVSIPTAMKAIRNLSRKAGLSFTSLVDMQKIGLSENLVLIRASRQAETLRVLSRFPYCRQAFRTYGSYDIFSVWDIPQENRQFPREFLQRMLDRKLIASFRLVQLQRDLQAVNFTHYDVSQGRWDIHWDSWGISLREDLAKRESFAVEYPSQGPKFRLDMLDLNILSSLQINCRMPFSAIARTLGVSGAYVGRRVARMERDSLSRYAVWPLKIGAEDWGLVGLSCSRETANSLARNLSKLPAWRGGFVNGDFEGLLAIVWCPNGELKQLFKAIDDRLVRNGLAQVECLNSIGEWVVARWLPVDPDDPWRLFTEDGKWMFDEQRYMSLIE